MVDMNNYPALSKVNVPADFRDFSIPELRQLCTDVRQYMVDVISVVGGHFGGGLGAVELTVAMHKVFNTPEDQITAPHDQTVERAFGVPEKK